MLQRVAVRSTILDVLLRGGGCEAKVAPHDSVCQCSTTRRFGRREFGWSRDGNGALTRRELSVLRLVAQGLGNKEIASELGISSHTVKYHLAALLGKLGVHSRTEAVTIGLRTGLVPL
jgi:DNA-binding NarL/FixJ family response regulator